MIYFIRAGDNGPIKIGITKEITGRVKGLQTAHYEDLQIVGVMPGDRNLETTLHNKFSQHHIRGEWFQPAEEILTFVQENCSGKDGAETQYLGNGEYRILLSKPYKATMQFILLAGTHRGINLICDEEENHILAIQGKAKILLNWLDTIGLSQETVDAYKQVLLDE